MGLAVELFFDEETDRAIRGAWQWLAKHEGLPFMHESGATPHISIAVFETGDPATQSKCLADFADTVQAFPIILSRAGAFTDTGVLFAAPEGSDLLNEIHTGFWTSLPSFGERPWEHYLPGKWKPHCTLAMETKDKPAAWFAHIETQLAAILGLPRPAHVCKVGLVEFRPVKTLLSCPLTSTGASPDANAKRSFGE